MCTFCLVLLIYALLRLALWNIDYDMLKFNSIRCAGACWRQLVGLPRKEIVGVVRCFSTSPIESAYSGGGRAKYKADEKVNVDRPVAPVRGSIEVNPSLCSGCGTPFQNSYPASPGYLTKDMFQEHRERAEARRRVKDGLKILTDASIDVQSALAREVLVEAGVPPDTIDSIQGAARAPPSATGGVESEEPVAVELSEAIEERRQRDEKNVINICQRCFKLKQYGDLPAALRPGFSDDALLTATKFEEVLAATRETRCVVLVLVDLFDMSGSMLAGLREIAGPNPLIFGANKLDLLPATVPPERLQDFVYRELKLQCGLVSHRENQGAIEEFKRQGMASKGWYEQNVVEARQHEGVVRRDRIHLISCTSGRGVKTLIEHAVELAREHNGPVHVVGAANVGKSSFINKLIDTRNTLSEVAGRSAGSKGSMQTKYRARTAAPQTTVSNVPGTTLNAIRIALPKHGVTFVDTPGLLNPRQLTTRLPSDELRQVIPTRAVRCITHRLAAGKVVLLGGLARVELLEGLPFFFTFFVSSDVTLHPTDATRADEVLERNVGSLLSPPHSVERMEEVGPLQDHMFEVQGNSWDRGVSDIVIAGLGWVCVTGTGLAKIKVSAPAGVDVSIREPLCPFEAWDATARFSGGKWVQNKSGSKRRKPHKY